MKQGRGGARRPPLQHPWTAVTQSRSLNTWILDSAFLLSCCVTVGSLLPLSGPASLQERPSCPQEIPAWGFSRQEAL